MLTFGSWANSQSPSPTKTQNLTSKAPIIGVEPWWQDPRWWAICATGLLGLLSVGTQWRYRITDRRDKDRTETFNAEVRDPVRETYKELRALSVEVSAICDIGDAQQRLHAIQEIRKNSACKALTCFSQVLYEAEQRLTANGSLSELNARLEDVLYPELAAIAAEQSTASLRASARRVSAAVVAAITDCDLFLRDARERHVRPVNCWRKIRRWWSI